ncbi:MAG: PAS domain-containing sensor histidine kinase [Pseudomonadota bacterium]|nr:PAS domain-containing sensor histidine kinase [Pseudomonadota bacterium]
MQADEDRSPGTGDNGDAALDAGAGDAERHAREQIWQFALQSHEYAVLCIDTGQTVTWASPGAAKILGEPADAIVGRSAARFFTCDDRDLGIPMHEVAVALSHGTAEDDRWMIRADGSRFWASGLLTAIRGPDGAATGFVKVLRNLTANRMQIETLHNRSEVLGAADKARTRSIATLSHELRNPLGAAATSASVLRQMAGDQPALQQALDILERNIGFAARLVDDMEDVGRVAEGKLSVQPEPLPLGEVLQASRQAALARARVERSPEIELLLPGTPIILECDRLRVQQVFANLIGNAIKFTPRGGRIWVKATIEAEEAVVRVEDDGEGIPADKLKSIFEMFTQVSASPGSSGPGLGIGLAVVKEIVELHGGSVQARSDGIGKGSEFTVRLPLQQLPPPKARQTTG